MGTLNPNEKERLYLARRLFEAFRLRGVPCRVFQVANLEYTEQKDYKVQYMGSVESYMMFEENPKAKLKKLEWFVEDEAQASLGYFVAFDKEMSPIKIIRETKVEIDYNALTGVTTQAFVLKDIRANDINQFSYVAKLTPFRERKALSGVSLESPNDRMPFRQVYLREG